jgi:hypothetical protein
MRHPSASRSFSAFSLIGIAGSYGVAWFGIRVNTFANSRTAFASLRGKPFPCYAIPLKAGMSIGMLLISVELFLMLCILLFIPGDYAGSCFIGFAIGESLGAAALRVAGGIFTKIADIGADLMKIVFKIKEDDARNPGVIADCTGDNAGDSVGPSADGFETYGVTGVALISFILLAVPSDLVKVELLVWIFVMRVMMIIASGLSYFLNELVAKARYQNVDKMNYETPLTSLVWLTSIISVGMTYGVSALLIPDLGGDTSMWWRLSTCHHLRHAGRRDYSRAGQDFHLGRIDAREGSGHVVARGRGVAQHSVGTRRRQLQRVLAGPDHDGADGDRVRREFGLPRRNVPAGLGRGLRVRSGCVRIPGHGPGHHRSRFLRSRDRQRAERVRALADRNAALTSRAKSRSSSDSMPISKRPSITSKRTTARAIPSRPPRNRC